MGGLNHALISVSDKTGVVEIAKGLADLGASKHMSLTAAAVGLLCFDDMGCSRCVRLTG